MSTTTTATKAVEGRLQLSTMRVRLAPPPHPRTEAARMPEAASQPQLKTPQPTDDNNYAPSTIQNPRSATGHLQNLCKHAITSLLQSPLFRKVTAIRGRSRNIKKGGGSSGILFKKGGSNLLLGAICIGIFSKGGVWTPWTPLDLPLAISMLIYSISRTLELN
jgi:hypothetical protein